MVQLVLINHLFPEDPLVQLVLASLMVLTHLLVPAILGDLNLLLIQEGLKHLILLNLLLLQGVPVDLEVPNHLWPQMVLKLLVALNHL